MKKQFGYATLIIILVALLSLVAGVVGYQVLFAEKHMQLIRTFDEARSVEPFKGKTHTGKDFSESDFLGQWNIVFFGFTTCPDICPTAMTNINAIMQNMDPQYAKDTQVIMISVDPERDTLEKLEQYVPAFNPEFIGVNAGWDTTQKLGKSIGVSFYKAPLDGRPDDYTIDHTARWFIIDPLGRRYAYVSPSQVERGKDLIMVVSTDYNILREKAGEIHTTN